VDAQGQLRDGLVDRDAFFRLSNDLLAVTDGGLRMRHLNPAWGSQLGRPPEVLQGLSLLEVVAPRDRDRVRETLEAILASGTARTFDGGLLRSNQQVRHAHFTVSGDPEARRLYVVARDITVRQRLEKELAAAQKLEAIGQLASGLAHEINTPTQFVGDNLAFLGDAFCSARPLLELLLSLDGPTPPSAEAWGEVHEAMAKADLQFLVKEVPLSIISACEGVERVAQLVRSLREFAHPDSATMARADLNGAVKRTLVVSRNEWKYVADARTELGEIPPVMCHLSAVNQVLLNLICNASHAIAAKAKKLGEGAPKGVITVSTSTDGHLVTIAVRDDGAGMPEAVKARIFEPFFTTKEVGHGTGQGLAISRSIVCDKHHGRLEFTSEEGVGTTFFVRLPIDQEVATATAGGRR
jgi:two-component system, NtrC family, sensor kinase